MFLFRRIFIRHTHEKEYNITTVIHTAGCTGHGIIDGRKDAGTYARLTRKPDRDITQEIRKCRTGFGKHNIIHHVISTKKLIVSIYAHGTVWYVAREKVSGKSDGLVFIQSIPRKIE